MQPHSISLMSPHLIYLLFLFWGVIIALLPQSAPKSPIRVGVRRENERLHGTLRRAIYSNYKTSEEARVAGCLPMFLFELLCIYFFTKTRSTLALRAQPQPSSARLLSLFFICVARCRSSLPASCSRILSRLFSFTDIPECSSKQACWMPTYTA